ncbi:hypothetical protein Tco_1311811 [Tanacetum coccineum]
MQPKRAMIAILRNCARRPVRCRECTYPDIPKMPTLEHQGTEGSCRTHSSGLKRLSPTTTPEAAHAMPWQTLKKMMTDKYCPRGEIKKLEFEMWNLKVKGNGDRDHTDGLRPLMFQMLTITMMACAPKCHNATDLVMLVGQFEKVTKMEEQQQPGNKGGMPKTQAKVYVVGKCRVNPGQQCRTINVISYTKAQEYLTKGCHVFLANITATKDEDKSKEKRLEDVPVVQEFPKVFPEDLPGIPPHDRQEEELYAKFLSSLNSGSPGYNSTVTVIDKSRSPSQLTKLTQKGVKVLIGAINKRACQLLKRNAVQSTILAYLREAEIFNRSTMMLQRRVGRCVDAEEKEGKQNAMDKLTGKRMYLKEVSQYGRPVFNICDRDPQVSRSNYLFWKSLQKALGTRFVDKVRISSEKPTQRREHPTLEDMLRLAPFEALYGRKCRSPMCWAEVGQVQLTGPELVQETTERIIQIKQRIQTARDRQKSYADLKRKPMEFQVGDKVMLKVSPWKGVVRFGKRGKLNPRYVGPFKVLKKVRAIAYKLELPQELSRVHNTFHVSNLKKCYSDDPLVVPLEGLQVDDKLHFVEEPVEIMDREVKQLRRSRVPIVKVRWNSRRGPEFTWECEDQFRKKYPHLFTKTAPSSSAVCISL